jgi:hypothetical protein
MRQATQSISCVDYATTAGWGPERQHEYEQLIDKSQYASAERMIADSAEALSSKGDQSWRTKSLSAAAHSILVREVQKWKIRPDGDLRADRCTAPQSLDEQQYSHAGCSWYSPDGMQEVSVDFMRKKKVASAPWLLNSAQARICQPDPNLTTAHVDPR